MKLKWPWKREEQPHPDLEEAKCVLRDHERRIRDLEYEYAIVQRMSPKTYAGPERRSGPRTT